MTLMLGLHIPHSESSAVFSEDRRYRYLLTRRWDDGPAVAFVGLNPSKANEHRNDATVRRFISFARSWGRGALTVGNLNAVVAPDPHDLAVMADPIGPDNGAYLRGLAIDHDLIVLAWGANADPKRARAVTSMLWRALSVTGGSLGVLGWTPDDQPRHPLYLSADTPLQCLTAGAHPEYVDVDARWMRLLVDTTDLDVDGEYARIACSSSASGRDSRRSA